MMVTHKYSEIHSHIRADIFTYKRQYTCGTITLIGNNKKEVSQINSPLLLGNCAEARDYCCWSLKVTGSVNQERTATPLFLPGCHLGIFFTTRRASWSRARSTPFTT